MKPKDKAPKKTKAERTPRQPPTIPSTTESKDLVANLFGSITEDEYQLLADSQEAPPVVPADTPVAPVKPQTNEGEALVEPGAPPEEVELVLHHSAGADELILLADQLNIL